MDTELRTRKGRWMSPEVATGLLITVGAFALAAMIFTVGDVGRFVRRQREYFAYYDDARMLKPGAPVTIAGVRVGYVKEVVDPTRSGAAGKAKVVIRLPRDVVLYRDAQLMLRQDGMLGDRYVELTLGTPDGSTGLDEGDRIVLATAESSFADIGKHIDKLQPEIQLAVEDLRKTIGKIREFMEGGSVNDIFTQFDKTISGIDEKIEDLKGPILEAVNSAKDTINGVRRIVLENETRINGSITDAEQVIADLNGRLQEIQNRLDEILVHSDRLITDNHANVYTTIKNLNEATFYMKEFSRKLNQNPAVLVFGTDDKTEIEKKRDETEFRKEGRLPPYKREP